MSIVESIGLGAMLPRVSSCLAKLAFANALRLFESSSVGIMLIFKTIFC